MLDRRNSEYRAYTISKIREIPQISVLPKDVQFEMEVVANVLPFKVNNYVIDELINWDNPLQDPMFILTFPQKDMLLPHHFDEMAKAIKSGADKKSLSITANNIRMQLNPHPAGQSEHNVPALSSGEKLPGIQHKYNDTVLFFPSSGQTCHAYCSFCFRWPQFVGMNELKFAAKEGDTLVSYLEEHPEITDLLFTGGDPMIMKAKTFEQYINPILESNIETLKTIRIGSKALSYWPYKFVEGDNEDQQILKVFEKITNAGYHLSFMAHFNHYRELGTSVVEEAISRIRSTGAEIRTQSPLLKHINDDSETWAQMWTKQVNLGCIPYYMFVVRDTGAQHYFGVPLVEAHDIFRNAYTHITGLARTVRGPSMSCTPGKLQILGTTEIAAEKVLILQFLRGRNPEWVRRPFLAKYDEKAIWLDDLKPLEGDKFFFEDELNEILTNNLELQRINPVKSSREDGPP